jgi:two-component system, response regulator PdtaR
MPDKKIFIVEDEPIVAMMLEDTLAQLGYEVAGTATNGNDAIRKIGETHPDLILMDIRIEGEMDGIETAEKVTSLYQLPVVYLTAHSDEKTLERAMATQPHGYLLKPFRTRELYSTLEIALYKHRLKSRTSPATPAEAPSPERVQKATTITLERAILDAMDIPVFTVNRDLKLVYFNAACETLFSSLGYPQPFTGGTLTEIASPQLIGWKKDYARIFETGNAARNRVSLSNGDRPVSFSVEKIPLSEQGTASYVTGIIIDITGEFLLDERIRTMNANYEVLLSRLSEITALTSGKTDPEMKKIADQVGEIVIAITKLDSTRSEHG